MPSTGKGQLFPNLAIQHETNSPLSFSSMSLDHVHLESGGLASTSIGGQTMTIGHKSMSLDQVHFNSLDLRRLRFIKRARPRDPANIGPGDAWAPSLTSDVAEGAGNASVVQGPAASAPPLKSPRSPRPGSRLPGVLAPIEEGRRGSDASISPRFDERTPRSERSPRGLGAASGRAPPSPRPSPHSSPRPSPVAGDDAGAETPTAPNRLYSVVGGLGAGGASVVVLVRHRLTRTHFALKVPTDFKLR